MLRLFGMASTRRPRERSDSGDAFIRESDQRTGTSDDLAEQLAEEFERSIATGEADDNRSDDGLEPEEIGGPFIESAADREFGATRSAPPDPETTLNPVPEAVGGLAVASAEEEQEEVEEDDEQRRDVDHPEPDAEQPSQMVEPLETLSKAASLPRR